MCQLLVCFCWFWRPAIIDRALNIDHGIDDDDDGDKADDDADEMRRRNIENGLGSSSRLELDGLMVMVKMVTMPTVSEKERSGTFGAEQLLTERCTDPILSNEPSPDVNLAFQYLYCFLFLFQSRF